ncbi:diguanylate phosphodiesterase, partial [candidate division KSB1 bacterium]|nr:diguanylate phosphodiesterase [candidate division KSB1 bacterium]
MEVFVARQPIFDRQQQVYAYELLFRSGFEHNFFDHWDGDASSKQVLTNSFLSIGMERLTNGKKAFINFTRKLLLDQVASIFPQNLMVVEILENVEPDEEIISACKNLKDLGYLLVLDDFVFAPGYESLIDLVDIIKVDFIQTQGTERGTVIQDVGASRIEYLAEKVET